jgi:cytochrome c biogenesis protein CcdA
MLRLIGLVVSIGIADSLNPTTIAPALYLATGERARASVTEFTFGVFVVYLAGGAAIALGPGQLVLSLLPHPGPTARHIIEVVAGVAMLVASALLWRNRDRLSDRDPPEVRAEGRSSAILGATITAVELPTAFPYFAVIAAIVGSGLDPARQLVLLVLFNVCFILPLLGIVGTLTFAGDRADRMLTVGRNFLQRRWPALLAALALLAGAFVVLLGVTGLTGGGHGRVGRFMRHLRHLIHP